MVTATELFARVLAAAPGFAPVMEEHLADNEELLSHLLMADCKRFIASYFTGRSTVPGKPPCEGELLGMLSAIEATMIDGDEETQNVIAVSFLEYLWNEPFFPALRPFLGPSLRAEIQRQMTWSHSAG